MDSGRTRQQPIHTKETNGATYFLILSRLTQSHHNLWTRPPTCREEEEVEGQLLRTSLRRSGGRKERLGGSRRGDTSAFK